MTNIANKYFVGQGQPYSTVTQVLNHINDVIKSGTYTLPSTDLSDGGNVNIVIAGGGVHQPFRVPDNMTPVIYDSGRRMVITRQEFSSSGLLDTSSVPIISSSAPGAGEVAVADKATGVDLGNNNPGITIRGVFVKDCVIGMQAGFNTNSLRVERCIVTNCVNAQMYFHDLIGLNLVNNVTVGGEYGIIAKQVGQLRAYHNTVFVDGSTALGGVAKAGVLIQGERLFGNASASTAYFAGNTISTVGAPCLIAYDGDLAAGRLVSDYNNFFRTDGPIVELRQDTTQLAGEAEVILSTFENLPAWRKASSLGTDASTPIDKNSISMDPIFIQQAFIAGTKSSILDLSLLSNSPLLGKVPAWYSSTDVTYIPSDFSVSDLSTDALLNTREKPMTSMGANDAPSNNGFFGQDVFTSPLLVDPEKSCDIDPLKVVTNQQIDMQYPSIMAGHFWSHERPYYLYARKGSSQLGFLARTTFKMPGHVLKQEDVVVSVQGKPIAETSWDIRGRDLIVSHQDNGIKTYEDEIQVEANVQGWNGDGFFSKSAYYVFKVKEGETSFTLPSSYSPQAPVVITDDRISLRDPIDLVRREFSVDFDVEREEHVLKFLHTTNMVENSMFNISETLSAPAYWGTDASFTDEVFMLGPNFSYYGDYAAGIKLGPTPGWLSTNTIPLDESEPITASWHARIPTGMGLTGVTGHYAIKWLDDRNDPTSDTDVVGTFHVSETGYSRFYLSMGYSDDLVSEDIYDKFGIPVVKTQEFMNIPSGVANFQLMLSGDLNSSLSPESFMAVDAVQVENSNYPTHYHPELSFDYMTVEWENGSGESFVDKRMNITPVFNENPNGFLCIQDMPATIWGGPDDENITTLHEHKWPVGRMRHLPWARLHGKDKLSQRTMGSEDLSIPQDIISPYAPIARPEEARMVPEVLNVVQYTGDVAGFNIQIKDNNNNPYGLRKYTAQVFDTNDNFPGLLSKRHFGAKEQLGTTIYGELNSNGSFSAEYVPLANNLIKYVGFVPVPENQATSVIGINEKISTITVPYRAHLENNGNVTVIGELGQKMSTEASTKTSLEIFGSSNDSTITVTLPHPPVFGSLSVVQNGVTFHETQTNPQAAEFLVSYAYGQFSVSAGIDTELPFEVQYIPKYAYPDPVDPHKIIFHHDRVFGNYSGPIQVDYDAVVFLEVRVEKPFAGELIANFEVVLQNPQLSLITNDSLSLEF